MLSAVKIAWHRGNSPFGLRWVITLTAPGGCFTNVSQALQRNLAKIHNAKNPIYGENFKLKLCMCAQSHALGTHTKFQLEILIRSTIFAIHKFREKILESSRNVSKTPPRRAETATVVWFLSWRYSRNYGYHGLRQWRNVPRGLHYSRPQNNAWNEISTSYRNNIHGDNPMRVESPRESCNPR